jgi:stearoyl-CoA desaturase (delta-9 desaturase)
VRGGFWHAHVGWYIGTKNAFWCFLYSIAGPLRIVFDGWHRPRTNRRHDHRARDVSEDGFYRLLSRPLPFMIACWLHALVPFGGAYLGWGFDGVAALWLTLVAVYNLGDAIDSVAHLYGARPFRAGHFARNNTFLGILALGEGWHANHHVFPSSARHGLFAGQFDAAWLMIRLLEKLKIARNQGADRSANQCEINRGALKCLKKLIRKTFCRKIPMPRIPTRGSRSTSTARFRSTTRRRPRCLFRCARNRARYCSRC